MLPAQLCHVGAAPHAGDVALAGAPHALHIGLIEVGILVEAAAAAAAAAMRWAIFAPDVMLAMCGPICMEVDGLCSDAGNIQVFELMQWGKQKAMPNIMSRSIYHSGISSSWR
jgi:hypothetical protein